MKKIEKYPKKNVIVLDCEQRTAEGILQSLGEKGLNVIGLSNKKNCPARYSRYMSHYFQSPSLSEGFDAYFNFLISLPFRGVLVPSGDLSAQFFSTYNSNLKKNGFLLNIVSIDILLQVFDKWNCHQLCKSLNIPVAKTELILDEKLIYDKIKWFNFPSIIKPTRLAGGNYIRFFSREEAIESYRKLLTEINDQKLKLNDSSLILQEWVNSEMEDNWSCDVFYDQNGKFKSALTIKRIRTSLNAEGTPTSMLFAGRVLINDELTNLTRKILESVNWRGLAHVEYIFDKSSKQYLLTEINPRLPGYSYFLSKVGYEFGYYYAADLLGIDYATPAKQPKAILFRTLRYPGDLINGTIYSLKGHISFLSLLKSYLTSIFSEEKIIIDHLNPSDIKLSTMIFLYESKLLTISIFQLCVKLLTSILK